jgi:hypothetical protein
MLRTIIEQRQSRQAQNAKKKSFRVIQSHTELQIKDLLEKFATVSIY